MNEMKSGVYMRDGEEISFEFNSAPSYAIKSLFVNSVVNSIVDEDYNYIIKDLVFNYMLISILTNVDMSYIDEYENPMDVISLIEDIVMNTNIVDIIKENLGQEIIDELAIAVEKGIEYKTGIHVSEIEKELSGLLKMFTDKTGKFNNSMDEESMKNFIELFANSKDNFTPEKLLEAYANTDMFKNRYKDSLEK